MDRYRDELINNYEPQKCKNKVITKNFESLRDRERGERKVNILTSCFITDYQQLMSNIY